MSNLVARNNNAVPKRARSDEPPPREIQTLPSRLIFLRERTGMTQARLAEKLGITAGQLSRIESGQQGITLEQLVRLARVLGAPVGFVIAEEGSLPPVPVFDEDVGDRRRRKSKPKSNGAT